MCEVWKDIPGYEGLYQVSDLGRVKSLIRKKIRKQRNQSCGYLEIELHNNGKRNFFLIHRLVAQAFIPNPENKPQVNHIDGNKKNNRVKNLEWCTHSENQTHAVKLGIHGGKKLRNNAKSISVAQYDKDMNLLAVFPSIHEASRATGVDNTSIGHGIKKGWKCGGYIWKVANERKNN